MITGGPAGQAELHLGAGSEHEYDPHDRERYNVTTFGESDIPVQISPAAVPTQNAPLTVPRAIRQPVAGRQRAARAQRASSFNGASPSLPLAWCLRCWACRSACVPGAEAAPRA